MSCLSKYSSPPHQSTIRPSKYRPIGIRVAPIFLQGNLEEDSTIITILMYNTHLSPQPLPPKLSPKKPFRLLQIHLLKLSTNNPIHARKHNMIHRSQTSQDLNESISSSRTSAVAPVILLLSCSLESLAVAESNSGKV